MAAPDLSAAEAIVVARVSALVEAGFRASIEQCGGDLSRCLPAILFVVRGIVNSKHISPDKERPLCERILLSLFVDAGAPLSADTRAAIAVCVDEFRAILRASKPNDWRARG